MLRLSIVSLIVLLFPASVHGSTITLTPSYVQSFDSVFAPLGALSDNGASTPPDGYLQFEVRITLTGTAADEDFWTAAFNVNLSPGLANFSGWLDPGTAQANGYYPASPSLAQYDSNSANPGGILSHWQFGNGDFGFNANDLQTIIVEASSSEAANRQYGELDRPAAGSSDGLGVPTLIGSFIVQKTTDLPAMIGITPILGMPWGTYLGNATGTGTPTSHSAASFTGGTLLIAVPEPTSQLLALMGIAFMGFKSRRIKIARVSELTRFPLVQGESEDARPFSPREIRGHSTEHLPPPTNASAN